MAIVRVEKTKDYTVLSNAHFREREMSLKAKGLLSLILSLPDDWDFSIAGLVSLSKDGNESVMNALNELEKFGYLRRVKRFDNKKRFAGYDYNVYECPNTENPNTENPNTENPNTENPNTENPNTENPNTGNPNTENPNTGNPNTGNPNTGNPTQLNTNILNTNILNTNISIPKECVYCPPNGEPRSGEPRTNENGYSFDEKKDEKPKQQRFKKPTIDDIRAYCNERGNGISAERFFDYYESNGWRVGKSPMKDWRATVRNWERNDHESGVRDNGGEVNVRFGCSFDTDDFFNAALSNGFKERRE